MYRFPQRFRQNSLGIPSGFLGQMPGTLVQGRKSALEMEEIEPSAQSVDILISECMCYFLIY